MNTSENLRYEVNVRLVLGALKPVALSAGRAPSVEDDTVGLADLFREADSLEDFANEVNPFAQHVIAGSVERLRRIATALTNRYAGPRASSQPGAET